LNITVSEQKADTRGASTGSATAIHSARDDQALADGTEEAIPISQRESIDIYT
jgi:hypothetical protein